MAAQNFSPALPAPAGAAPYPMAQPGYGKRSAPDQLPAAPSDFALLPLRERYVAGFIEHLPEGASMSVKCLAKQIPLYGQQAIASALTALSVAGHLRRVRCAVGVGDEVRWVFRTFWSRTARDNEWWANRLTPGTVLPTAPVAGSPTPHVMMECTDCGAPGPAEALPDGLCRPCRRPETTSGSAPEPPAERDVTALVAGLRDLLKAP